MARGLGPVAERPLVEPRVAAPARALSAVRFSSPAFDAGNHLRLHQACPGALAVLSRSEARTGRAVGTLDVRVAALPNASLTRLRSWRRLSGLRWLRDTDRLRRLRSQRPGATVVLGLRHGLEMSRRNAVPYATQVVDVHAVGNLAVPRLVGQSVRADGSPLEGQSAVAAFRVDVTSPNPAPVGLDDAGPQEPAKSSGHAPIVQVRSDKGATA